MLQGEPAVNLSPVSVGSFAIWQFMGHQRYDWALVDNEAESIALMGFSTGLPKSTNLWRPTTYQQPIEKICDEAIEDINRTLRKYVFPVIQLNGYTVHL